MHTDTDRVGHRVIRESIIMMVHNTIMLISKILHLFHNSRINEPYE